MNGKHYTVTANEGDSRDWWFSAKDETSCLQAGGTKFDDEDGCLSYSEEVRAGKLTLAANHPQRSHLDKEELGRLKVTKAMGDEDGDVDYFLNRDLSVDFEINDSTDPVTLKGDYMKAGDLAPEGMRFVAAKDSPIHKPLLLVASEVSGTVSVYQLR